MIMNRQIALFAAAATLAVSSLAASGASANPLDYRWASNQPYVNCMRNAHTVAMTYPLSQRNDWYDKLRRACNRGYYPNGFR
ncbi:hypothetical protein [Bradyrhizobium sp. USDA 4353]